MLYHVISFVSLNPLKHIYMKTFDIDMEAKNPMRALKITPERCEELCTAIEEESSKHTDWSFGKVLNEVYNVHCKNENERLFVMYVFGTHQGGDINQAIGQLFAHINKADAYRWGKEKAEMN